MTMTKGEYRIGKSFNPSGDDMVAALKSVAADLIDLIETIRNPDDQGEYGHEVMRLKSLAQTRIEEAAMWAVKAATKQPREGV